MLGSMISMMVSPRLRLDYSCLFGDAHLRGR
jgi:hypothetical protein